MSDLIIGIHSIACAIKNKSRRPIELVATDEGMKELQSKGNIRQSDLEHVKKRIISNHALQEEAKKRFMNMGMEYQRIPSGIFFECEEMETKNPGWLFDEVRAGRAKKIICLDQVTDVHNGAAILRTAAFYGVDALVVSSKGSFAFSPSFFRIASGASEFVPIVKVASLPPFVERLKELETLCVGFSEHATDPARELAAANKQKMGACCLFMGAEDKGLSHAVERLLPHKVALPSQGEIKSLNVSVASAVAMEIFFSL